MGNTDALLKRRYEVAPQLEVYAGMTPQWVPHLMQSAQPDMRTDVCNTDEHGFRLTYKDGAALDYAGFQKIEGPKGILCGGPVAFGVGASNDAATIASALNRISGITWFNFASPPYNCTQELLRFLLFLPKVDHVVLFTGLNSLAIHTSSPYFSDIYGSFFQQDSFQLLERISSNPQYIKYLLGRARNRLPGPLRKLVPGAAPTPSSLEAPDLDSRYEKSVAVLARALDGWAGLRDGLNFSLIFVLQPRATWMGKKLTPEEEEMNDIYNAVASRGDRWGSAWNSLESNLDEIYPRYQEDTRRLCQEREIPWLDANERLPQEGWLFSYGANLTDQGQQLAAELINSACN